MPGNGRGSSWRHCRLVTSHHATWSCLLSVSNALSTAYLFEAGNQSALAPRHGNYIITIQPGIHIIITGNNLTGFLCCDMYTLLVCERVVIKIIALLIIDVSCLMFYYLCCVGGAWIRHVVSLEIALKVIIFSHFCINVSYIKPEPNNNGVARYSWHFCQHEALKHLEVDRKISSVSKCTIPDQLIQNTADSCALLMEEEGWGGFSAGGGGVGGGEAVVEGREGEG